MLSGAQAVGEVQRKLGSFNRVTTTGRPLRLCGTMVLFWLWKSFPEMYMTVFLLMMCTAFLSYAISIIYPNMF